ncbi:MAG: hypothetical protein E7585_08065 [Ruminococcaceae bacterium]|nr:hypothetical protein [Oscillospiraceae bacterium]
MGQFIITRTEKGTQFTLRSDKAQKIAVSKSYAHLDACKKSICSLVYYAPIVPVVDATAGQRGANPKLEIWGGKDGYCYTMKAPNGKGVIEGGPFDSKKACLRAIAMLRTAVRGATVVMAQPGQVKPLRLGKLVQDQSGPPA